MVHLSWLRQEYLSNIVVRIVQCFADGLTHQIWGICISQVDQNCVAPNGAEVPQEKAFEQCKFCRARNAVTSLETARLGAPQLRDYVYHAAKLGAQRYRNICICAVGERYGWARLAQLRTHLSTSSFVEQHADQEELPRVLVDLLLNQAMGRLHWDLAHHANLYVINMDLVQIDRAKKNDDAAQARLRTANANLAAAEQAVQRAGLRCGLPLHP